MALHHRVLTLRDAERAFDDEFTGKGQHRISLYWQDPSAEENASQTWSLLNLALWWKHHIEEDSLEELALAETRAFAEVCRP